MIAAICADGGCVQSNPSPYGGTWAWCAIDADGQRVIDQSGVVLTELGAHSAYAQLAANGHHTQLLRRPSISNNVMEYLALRNALRTLPDGWRGTIYSDSQITLGRLFAHKAHDGWTLLGVRPAALPWRVKGIPDRWVEDARAHVERLGPCTVQLLNGHPTAADFARGFGKRGYPVSEHNVHVDGLCSMLARAITDTLLPATATLRAAV